MGFKYPRAAASDTRFSVLGDALASDPIEPGVNGVVALVRLRLRRLDLQQNVGRILASLGQL